MHDQSSQRCASLPGGAGGREGDAAHGQVELRRGSDDGRVVATELEDAATESGRHHRRDLAPHRRRAGGADQRDALVGDHRRADARIPEQHLRQVRRCVDLLRGALEQRLGGERGQRGQLAGLPQHRVAAHDGQRGVPRPHGDREVERADDPDRAERMPLLHQPVAGSFGRDGQAVQLAAQADGEVADVDHLLHLAECLALDLAGLDLHQSGEVGLLLAQGHGEQADQLAAQRRRRRAPLREGLVGASDRIVDIGRCADRAERAARDRRARRGPVGSSEWWCTAGGECGGCDGDDVVSGGQAHPSILPADRSTPLTTPGGAPR